jgi:hypothetical protein
LKKTPKRLKSLLTAAVILTLGVSGCSVGNPQESSSPIATAPGVAGNPGTSYYDFVTETSGFVPYVEGMNLIQARAVVEASGLKATFVDSSPLAQAIDNEVDWIVFKQPKVGAEHPRNTEIRFSALRKGDPIEADALEIEFEWSREDFISPNFVGMNLSDVERIADKSDMYLVTKDVSPEDRNIFASENWEVVSQDRNPGSLHGTNSMWVKVQKIGETFETAKKLDNHNGERQFFGQVTGYERTYGGFGYSNLQYVQVDGAQVALDLISPYTFGCQGAGDAGLAEAEKRAVLPIGTLVRVVKTDPENDELAVIHPIDTDDLINPLRNSANETLVSRGYWIPTQSTNYDDVAYSSIMKYIVEDEYQTALQRRYLEILIKVASETRSKKTGGQAICYGMALKYEKQRRIDEIQMKKDEARWAREAERQYQLWLESHSCAGGARDGDGDGICNEG